MNTNMKEKLPVAQRLVYGKLLSEDSKCCHFVITANLRKSCMLASKRYKDDLEKQKESVQTWKISSNAKQWLTNLKESNVGNKRQQIIKRIEKKF